MNKAERHKSEPKKLNLALQGGGAHGAFTWGVFDRLLEDSRIEIEGICGTSAGAMNAAALASGFCNGGAAGARASLDRFWAAIAEMGRSSPIQRSLFDRMMGSWRLDHSPSYVTFDFLSRMFSPYQLNPFDYNPLQQVLHEVIDFDRIQRSEALKLFICATNVRSGKVKVFRNPEVGVEALLASACLPFMFQAVEHEGEHYWDGGYMGNPAIYPLIYDCDAPDVLIVQINPIYQETIPTTAREILDRVNEISFNSSLMREMRAVHFVTRLIDAGKLNSGDYKRMNIHMVEADQDLKLLGASSKMNAEPEFLDHLKDVGQRACDAWLAKHFEQIGVDSTVDLLETYL